MSGKNWKDLSGEKNWEGLLNPLDVDLRRYLIHYGERTGAFENAFNNKQASKGYGYSLYPPEGFFSKLCLQNGNPYKYAVTNFFYALTEVDLLPWSALKDSVWMGTVAVATDEGVRALGRRDIMISWRGTATTIEWMKDILESNLVSAPDIFGGEHNPKVHRGFLSIYTAKNADIKFSKTSARDQILKEVRRLVEKYQDEEISVTVTGHSLGAALATLTAMDVVANGYNKPANLNKRTALMTEKGCMVTAFAFASPRVGDDGFQKVFSGLNDVLHILRVRNTHDVVPLVPFLWYTDVGEELVIDTSKSTYLKPNPSLNLPVYHDLEVYLFHS